MKTSLVLDLAFKGLSMEERITKAAGLGFDGFEICMGYKGLDPVKIKGAACRRNIRPVCLALHNAHEMTLEKDIDELLPEIEEAAAFAREAGFLYIVMVGGDRQADSDIPNMLVLENLKHILPVVEKAGLRLLIEPVNNILEHRSKYLSSSIQAARLCAAAASKSVGMLYDFFHMQVMEGNLLHNIYQNRRYIAHFHLAGIPGHDEPQNCELNYPYILQKISEMGYDGYFGMEYVPGIEDEDASLKAALRYVKGNCQ